MMPNGMIIASRAVLRFTCGKVALCGPNAYN